MGFESLTAEELELVANLPRPPARIDVRVTNIWIVEWLPAGERRTGLELKEWANEKRPRWASYNACRCKADVLAAIELAADVAARSGMIPVLHLEAHGSPDGLAGPDGGGRVEILTWDELSGPLQELNVATRCNLVVLAAACTGIAAIKAFTKGPRAPALALIGPLASIYPGPLLAAMKEFYRRLAAGGSSLEDICESASHESAPVAVDSEPFMALNYESFIEALVSAARPLDKDDSGLATASLDSVSADLQRDWDRMFMIDLYPENAARFSLDVAALMRLLSVAAS